METGTVHDLPFVPEARWIWGEGEESPRNEWRCFRTSFIPVVDSVGKAELLLSADTRYVLYVNGVLVGRGPVRSYHHQYAYDVYEISHLLHSGAPNSIAVLVLHFGVATFYSLRGRGGLLAQLTFSGTGSIEPANRSEASGAGGKSSTEPRKSIVTDSSWKTELHAGHDPHQARMSVQHAFAESTDARLWDDSWTEAGFDDSGWQAAHTIGPVGTAPWTGMMERDIPMLTEEVVYPARVESLNQTRPPAWSIAIDVKYHWEDSGADHANHYQVAGMVAALIRLFEPGLVTLCMVETSFLACAINGQLYEKSDFDGEDPKLELGVELTAGDHLLLLDVSGKDHGKAFRIALDANVPFEVVSPLESSSLSNETQPSPVVTVGPYKHMVIKDTDVVDAKETEDYVEALSKVTETIKQIKTIDDLVSGAYPVKAISPSLVRLEDTFAMSIWKQDSVSHAVPVSLQLLAAANGVPVEAPLFEGSDTEFVLDFGKQWSGFLEFELNAPEGTVIDMYGYEFQQDGWRQETYGLDNTLRYICREGRQSYVSPVRRGFRYLMVTVRGGVRPTLWYKVVVRQSNFPVAQIGEFQCSDPLLNDIWEISRHTTRLCMEDTFVDCPAYEQTFWVGDSRNEALVNYYVFGATDIVERCMRLVPGSAGQTPYYGDQVPSGWVSVIPNWTFFWVIACKEYVDYTGKIQFAEDIWPHVKYTLDHYLQHIGEDGLFSFRGWNLLDWAPIDQPRDGVVTHQTMFLVKTLYAAAELAETANDSEQAVLYRERAAQLAEAINRQLWSEEQQAYVDCIHADGRVSSIFSMQTQVVALICHIANGKRESILREYLLAPPEHFVKIGSPFMSFFYYEALAKYGETGRMLEDIRQHFGEMIENDATTCWEMYPGFKENRANPRMLTRSHCHAWSAAPGYFLGDQLLGVKPLTPGWTQVKVAPSPGDLRYAKGRIPLPVQGCIEVSWKLDAQQRLFQIRVSAPKEIQLEVECPTGYTPDITIVRI
ncbi:family 78 glycoside hydrolase catalytic domain [Paenibacillus periandrae]|uniref:family 78 glycoside hydrolase catalytic domain n=1 Tax=Paenibacillus periandrae TaxID=1761741 RepID=UPI001F09EDE9|nr:family 78 glycoside hydrolase catalytic domain [Paenibacillus periandrae]